MTATKECKKCGAVNFDWKTNCTDCGAGFNGALDRPVENEVHENKLRVAPTASVEQANNEEKKESKILDFFLLIFGIILFLFASLLGEWMGKTLRIGIIFPAGGAIIAYWLLKKIAIDLESTLLYGAACAIGQLTWYGIGIVFIIKNLNTTMSLLVLGDFVMYLSLIIWVVISRDKKSTFALLLYSITMIGFNIYSFGFVSEGSQRASFFLHILMRFFVILTLCAFFWGKRDEMLPKKKLRIKNFDSKEHTNKAMNRLKTLDRLFENKMLTPEEYEQKRKEIINSI